MITLARVVAIEGVAFIVALFGVVAWKLASGYASMESLLFTRHTGHPERAFSPARLQLLIFTVVVAVYYLHSVIVNPHMDSLPDLPSNVVSALGGSQSVYLLGKALDAYIQPLHRKSR